MTAAIVAWGAISALGEGDRAFAVGPAGQAARTCVGRDDELARAGLTRPIAARAEVSSGGRDRATALLEGALSSCARALDEALPGWRGLRVGLAVGTSSGGMRTFEASAAEPVPLEATYLGPVLAAARPCDLEPFTLVLGACASSTIAIGLARQWLSARRCDVALAGGFDAVSVFVAAGFEALRATSATGGPRPFRLDRDGLALGEGAAILAMVGHDAVTTGPARARAWVTGFGASCDAAHLTAPDREGNGLRRALERALASAPKGPAVGLVSAHGTATTYNDDAEAIVVDELLGAARPVVHGAKGTVGHTLGAAGALEALAAVDAMRAGIAPATWGRGAVARGLEVLDANAPLRAIARAVKLATAFGGANAALVLDRDPPAELASRAGDDPVTITRAVVVSPEDPVTSSPAALAAATGYAEDRIARADDLVRLTLAAVHALEQRVGGRGALRGAGVVVGHGLATLETNRAFLARIRAAGAARAEPRRFPFTTPNAAAGEAAIAFGLTGPAFAVGGGAHGGIEALAAARDLVRAELTDRVVVVAVDASGVPGERRGAVAILVGAGAAEARMTSAVVRLPKAGASDGPLPAEAHRALLPLASGSPPFVEAELPAGGFAKASFFWL